MLSCEQHFVVKGYEGLQEIFRPQKYDLHNMMIDCSYNLEMHMF